MSILSEAVLEEIRQIVREEVFGDANEVKLEDARIIVQALLPEIDKMITSKFNKFSRRLAMDIISWDLVKETEEEPVVLQPGYIDERNTSRVEVTKEDTIRRESLDQ